MGHLNRCHLIADYLFTKKNIQSIIVMKDDNAAKEFISNKFLTSVVQYIDDEISLEEETSFISNLVKLESVNLILLDLLEKSFHKDYLKILKANNIPISVISDDSKYRVFNADLILNGNPNQIAFDYNKEPGSYLTGPQFFIMDPLYSEYVMSMGEKSYNSENKNILLTLGGSDHNNLMFNIIKILDQSANVSKVTIISTKASGYLEELNMLLRYVSKEFILLCDVNSLYPHWIDCDLAFTAGGNTLFERIASGTPGATVCQLPRQMEIADKFQLMGVNHNIGYGPDIKYKDLEISMNNFISDQSGHKQQIETCKNIKLGNGIELFTNKLCELIEGSNELR